MGIIAWSILLTMYLILSFFIIPTLALKEASPGQFPYTASLQIASLGGHTCAGAILSPWWVLSTATCADTDDSLDHEHFIVVAGEWDLQQGDGTEQVRHVDKVFRHPYFSEQGCDIALIRLNASLEFGEFVSSVSLATMNEKFPGSCIESGWSQLGQHLKLQYAEPVILPTEDCQANPSTGTMGFGALCAGDQSSGTAVMCPGYSGSPLACSREDNSTALAGLQAFTYSCFESGAPSVYADVAGLRDWIDYILSKYQD